MLDLSYSLTSSNPVTSTYPFTRITSLSLADNKPFHWNLASHGVNGQNRGIVENNKEPITTVVLLGWLGSKHKHLSSYGAILDNLQGRPDLLERIKGCVFDSGGDHNINPKVWAAGFAAALLKKRSSATYPSVDAGEDHVLENGMTVSKMGQKEPLLVEIILLLLLEKLFSFLLNMPDINQRLTKIISGLSKNHIMYS